MLLAGWPGNFYTLLSPSREREKVDACINLLKINVNIGVSNPQDFFFFGIKVGNREKGYGCGCME